eukprot:4367311-Pyramimonas_sp.AAC.1
MASNRGQTQERPKPAQDVNKKPQEVPKRTQSHSKEPPRGFQKPPHEAAQKPWGLEDGAARTRGSRA